jgi:hypothetical protein
VSKSSAMRVFGISSILAPFRNNLSNLTPITGRASRSFGFDRLAQEVEHRIWSFVR